MTRRAIGACASHWRNNTISAAASPTSRSIGWIAAAAALGGAIGGILAGRVSTWIALDAMLGVLALLSALIALTVAGIGIEQMDPTRVYPRPELGFLYPHPVRVRSPGSVTELWQGQAVTVTRTISKLMCLWRDRPRPELYL